MATKQSKSVYQIKISLIGAKPPIWRTVLVSGNLKLAAFHDVIQVAMGWTDSHLHQFIANQVFYGIPDDEFELEMEDESKYKLSQLLKKEKESLIYEYDFGDSWEHKILLEKILPTIVKLTCRFALKVNALVPRKIVAVSGAMRSFLKQFQTPSILIIKTCWNGWVGSLILKSLILKK